MPPPVRVYLVMEKLFGHAQGLSQLVLALQRRRAFVQIGFAPHPGADLLSRIARRGLRLVERAWLLATRVLHPSSLAHFFWGDALVGVYPPNRNCLATLHQPHEKWAAGTVEWCRGLGGVLTMAEREAVHLRAALPGLPVRCVLYGVDVDFWRPPASRPAAAPRLIVFTGRYMRNLPMFFRVIRRILAARQEVTVEIMLNPGLELPAEFLPLPPQVRQVGPFSAVELRAFLQSAWLMFMPYDNVTASNSVCEALGCGLPLFTTRVGGMESYARGGVVLFENNDDDAACAAVLRCLAEPAWRDELSAQGRAAAVQHLDWNRVAAQVDEFYREAAARRAAR